MEFQFYNSFITKSQYNSGLRAVFSLGHFVFVLVFGRRPRGAARRTARLRLRAAAAAAPHRDY